MILAIDVGNTNIVLGVYDGEELTANWRITTLNNRTADETGTLIRSLFSHSNVDIKDIESVIISSVVPNIMYSLTNAIRKQLHIEPMIVGSGMKTGINLRMENPKEMGADRIVNLVAAYEIYGGPVVVVDYSTATMFDVISENGEFITAITAPGVQVCADALYQRAAQLPKIEIKGNDLNKIIRDLELDDYYELVESKRKGETVWCFTLHQKGQAFYREILNEKRWVYFKISMSVALAIGVFLLKLILDAIAGR